MNKDFINKIQRVLLNKKENLEKELKNVSEDDPLLADGLVESSEPGTDSWLSETHSQLSVVSENLKLVLRKVQKALEKLNTGKYGICEKCGKAIEIERLNVRPESSRCISCSARK